ncbi:MAG: M23 family peptidase, partial [Lachnospiraceae bacterium]|nr:M23 family peptidase [Lachnospiraceae bacterium]
LSSYSNIENGMRVKAGDLLGFVGDSGYGKEGTVGKFPVHLHVGVYIYDKGQEISLNPYNILCYLENKKLKYAYF